MGFAIGGAILGSAFLGSQASGNAASAQQASAAQADATQLQMFNQQQANEKPYLDAGYSALGQMQNNMSSYNTPFSAQQFQQDPGYQFDLQQGQASLQNSAAAQGGIVSGGQMAALSNYSQNAASNEYQNAYNRYNTNISNSYNRLASLAGLGQTANGSLNTAGSNTANAISQNQIGAGNAAAAGMVGQANAISGAVGQGIGAYQSSQMMNMFGNANPGSGGFTMSNLNGSSNMAAPSMSYDNYYGGL